MPSRKHQLLVDERVEPGYASIALFEEVGSCVVEWLAWHPASPSAGRDVVHGLDLIRDRIPVCREMSANHRSRFVNTISTQDAAAGMNPETIFGVRLRKQCCTPDGIEFDKNLVEVAHEQFRRCCVHNGLSLNVLSDFLGHTKDDLAV